MAVQGSMLPFAEAEDYFRQKVSLPTRKWDDLRHGAHVRAFSVAGMTRDDMLTETRAMIERVRKDGLPFEEFRKSFGEMVERTGWKFNALGKTDAERIDWRARIIWKTNARTAYMAGRYRQMTDPDVLRFRPYWQYRHGDSLHPRKMHLAWDGMVLLATDPWWSVHYPPNGFGCSCSVEALSARDLSKIGKAGPDPAPEDQSYPGKDPRTGAPETRWPGVDRGWEYNVGQGWMTGVVPRELAEPLPAFEPERKPDPGLPDLPPPTAVTADQLLPEGQPDQYYIDAFLGAFGIAGADAGGTGYGYFRDRSGGIVTLSDEMFQVRTAPGEVIGTKSNKNERGPYMRLLAEAIRDPDEIWADWAEVRSGVVLKRSYLRRFLLPDRKALFIRFEWTRAGWAARTGFQTQDRYLKKARTGALLYRRSPK